MTWKQNAFYSQLKQLGIVTTIPIILLVGPGIGFFTGGWIDRKAHTYPWITVFFTALGFAAAAREIVRLLRQVLKESEDRVK